MELTGKKEEAKKRRRKLDVDTMIYGKVPPQEKDVEEAILGACLLEKSAYNTASGILRPECFYVESHQRIFKAMGTLELRNEPIDILTTISQLRTTEELDLVGGPYYVTKLTNAVVSSANLEYHCRIILRKFLQRELIRLGGEMVNNAYDDDCDIYKLMDESEQALLSVGTSHLHSDMQSMDTVLIKTVQQIEEWRHQDSTITGVPSKFTRIDQATRGWQPGDLIVIGARPSVGKTALALTLAMNAADNDIKPVAVALWSLEMRSVQLMLRMLSAKSQTTLHRLQTGRLDDKQMEVVYKEGIQKLSGYDIFFDDSGSVNLFNMRGKARRLKKKHPNLGLIVLDYLQLMSGDGSRGTREQEVSAISRGLKLLALELNIPIIALSQLNRGLEGRSGAKREPQISDLRESGGIEQDADVIGLLWGPEEEEIEIDATLANKRYFKIAKARNGVLIRMEFEFQTEIQLINQYDGVVTGAAQPQNGFRPVQNLPF